MGVVVTGISQNGEMQTLKSKLQGSSHSLECLEVISPGDVRTDGVSRLADSGIMTDAGGGGTSVPGISGNLRRVNFSASRSNDRLSDLEIPDSEIENYIDALDAGRTVVGFFARPDTVADVEGIFRDCGLVKVKTF